MTQSLAEDLELETPDGPIRIPAMWLRDNCLCSSCKDPRTGQKLFGITDVPERLTIGATHESADSLQVDFAPDGHRSDFPRAWLLRNAPVRPTAMRDIRTEDTKQLWSAADLAGRLPSESWKIYRHDPDRRAACLRAVLQLGFVVLREVPCEAGTVLRVAESFGYVRETNYGRLFDVVVKPNPNNLAFTGLTITPHTDNPYRDPVPTVQLLHCLSNAAAGGDSGLVDGFKVAAELRAQAPRAFEILTRTPVVYAFRDADAELIARRPVIDVDSRGTIREVRFSNRHMQPLQVAYDEIVDFYTAYRQFAHPAYAPEMQLVFKLDPGDCMVFDNTRILHARTAFESAASRHLQGCYADLDSLASTLAVLSRTRQG